MNNTLKTLLAAAALGAASLAQAVSIPSTGTVDMANTIYDGNLVGGEFAANVAGFDTIYTFCLEKEVQLDLPGTYNYALSNATAPSGDVLSVGSAWIYKKFAVGNLYDRLEDGNGGTHDVNAGLLQLAIWKLEDEYGNPYISNGLLSGTNWIYDSIITHFGSLAAAQVDYVGTEVRVMQLTDGNGDNVQDQIVYVADSGATLALLGFALTGLAISRRRAK